MEEKRCVLCNKPYNYKYAMFGRGCLDNLYALLKFSKPPGFIWNKESYLCTQIAWKNHKFFLNKNKILKDINNISVFSNIVETISFSLNDIYKLFNYYEKFEEIIKELQNINWEEIDEKIA